MDKTEFIGKIAVSVTEAAELLGVSRPAMYEILNRADCNADFKLGARRMVSVKALQEWVDKQVEDYTHRNG